MFAQAIAATASTTAAIAFLPARWLAVNLVTGGVVPEPRAIVPEWSPLPAQQRLTDLVGGAGSASGLGPQAPDSRIRTLFSQF